MKKMQWIDPETEEVLIDTESVLSVDGSGENDNMIDDTIDDGFGGQGPLEDDNG